jgi:hypothetical protein
MTASDVEQYEDMGPVDWVILEWAGERPSGEEVAPLIVDLVDRGIVRVLDIGFIAKDSDGTMAAIDFDHLGDDSPFAAFAGASSGLLDHEDLKEAGHALTPDHSAAVIVWENRWSAPLTAALRRSGGELVGSGRLPLEALLEALDNVETVR